MASVHELEAARARHEDDARRAPRRPREEPTPDRAAALNMLGTFDLDGIDVSSPDEVLANLEASARVPESADAPKHAEPREGAGVVDGATVHDSDSDEILRELEEHHRRAQPSSRPSAPRGSAQRHPAARRSAARARSGRSPKEAANRSKGWGRHKRSTLLVAAVVPLTLGGTIALSQIGGTPRSASRASSGTLTAAAEITPFPATKIFGALANLFAVDARRVSSHGSAAVKHHRKPGARKPKARHRPIRQTAAAPVASTAPTTSSVSSASSSSGPTSSSQPAPSEPAPATTTKTTQPAFGQNGSLGPGRGAAGTQ